MHRDSRPSPLARGPHSAWGTRCIVELTPRQQSPSSHPQLSSSLEVVNIFLASPFPPPPPPYPPPHPHYSLTYLLSLDLTHTLTHTPTPTPARGKS